MTPMMKQYLEIKERNKDCLLFFRLGDFYEMFFNDALIASHELDIALTGRDCGEEERAPMCGVPYHSCDGYIARLIKKGYKVAICEQTEDPALAKGLVRREIVRIITPGTVIDANMLDENRNNYICSIYLAEFTAGVCVADVSTGEIHATHLAGEDLNRSLINELGRFSPSEALLNDMALVNKEITAFLGGRLTCLVEEGSKHDGLYDEAEKRILAAYHVGSLSVLGISGQNETVLALGGLLAYLAETQKSDNFGLTTLNYYTQTQFVDLDITTRRNLELLETMRAKEKRGSLFWVLDETVTAMGSRTLRRWIEQPLMNIAAIRRRQMAVSALFSDTAARGELRITLKNINDLSRLITRVVYGSANARDLRMLSDTFGHLPDIKRGLVGLESALISDLDGSIDLLEDVKRLIDSAIVDEPPFSIREGGMIRRGYNEEVDRLRSISSGGRETIASVEAAEREKTGIRTLKISYNRVFGYYIEVSKSFIPQVPEGYIRKQTLSNCERYITQELKELESEVLQASDRLTALEGELFGQLRESIAVEASRVQRTASALADLDVLQALAECAAKYRYTMPEIDYSDRIQIKDGRHPVVERMLGEGYFIPNDMLLDNAANRVAIITGPNMAGKSTYMRQNALIVLMAQMGSFVPAESASIGMVDRIFTRVGASDDLASGQSTFMVEMNEMADILRNATKKSLLIIDEIGRGTSTFDGMAIARSVLEYIRDRRVLGAKTLFATHYHELTVLEESFEGIKNYNIAVKKRGDDITFLRKIVKGGADRSYGIEVAKLAGLPEKVISRAKTLLAEIEREGHVRPVIVSDDTKPEELQISMEQGVNDGLTAELKNMNLDTLTPIEALNTLYRLKNIADNI